MRTCLTQIQNTFAFFIICVFLFASCKKDDKAPPPEPPLVVEEITNTNDPAEPVVTIPTGNILQPTRPQLNFIFDWETAANMPTPPGKPIVPTPWSDAAIRNYDPGIRYDFKKSDGWEMMYNNFSDSSFPDNRIFVLYNKFRGLLRYYSYNPRFVPADVHNRVPWLINEINLHLPGDASPMFNFAGQSIVDMDINKKNASMVEPWPLQQGGWYISQFEMAYDRNATNFPVPQNDISWTLNFASVNDLTLNEVSATNRSISLLAPNLSFNSLWAGAAAQVTADFNLQVKSATGLDVLSSIYSTTAFNNLEQAANEGRAGNMLSATLAPAAGIIDCKLDANGILNLRSDLVGYVPGLGLALPGPDNSKVFGMGPVFNEPMGIFYLGAKPVIKYSKNGGATPEQYALDVSSIEYIINPFVKNYAEVDNFRQEIVAVDEKETKSLAEAKIYTGKILKASKPLKILGVRVSFDVTPRNGSAPIKMIKTFAAKLQ